MSEPLSLADFLEKKRDFSPYLVHLTKDGLDEFGELCVPAKDVLDYILGESTLKAFSHFCLFSPNLDNLQNAFLGDKFKVVCFTETPLENIDALLKDVIERGFKPKPYGLVFKKQYIREHGGNPVFYVTKDIAKPLWKLYWPLLSSDTDLPTEEICKLLALVTVCEEGNDWHWEREWRIVGDLNFNLYDIYCGFCPENDISYFEAKYSQVKFISPYWRSNKILSKVLGK